MDDLVYITGHRNPDTDSVCAAIAYSHLKRKLGIKAVPVRLGEISLETSFVLKYFDLPSPPLLYTVKRQVSDLNIDSVSPISPHISIKTAWSIMQRNNMKVLPVVDEHEKILGIVTLSDITNKYMNAIDNNTLAASHTPIENILDTINAKLLVPPTNPFTTTGKIHVAASSLEDIHSTVEKGDILIIGKRTDVFEEAVKKKVSLIVLTMVTDADPELLKSAKDAGIVVMASMADTFTVARLINQSIPINYVMTKTNLSYFEVNDLVDDIRDKMLKTRYRSYPVVDNNNHVVGFISRYHLISPRQKKVILVDHNDMSQTVDGIEQAEILEIIDHHRLGDIQTGNPIFFKNEPVGSTSTIIANMYFNEGIRPSQGIAGIMCAAILSDTLKFMSPTCTYTDKMTAERLAEIAGINIEAFSAEMFKAGSTLKGRKIPDIVRGDLKDYLLGSLRVGIGQVYTQDLETLASLRDKILEEMDSVQKEFGFGIVMLLVTDILNKGSEMLVSGPQSKLVAEAFNQEIVNHSLYLAGVVSRKKQVLPKLATVSA
jgi:manganese-dependent inorganic pyrophosphatase